jgi:hypothetical protein
MSINVLTPLTVCHVREKDECPNYHRQWMHIPHFYFLCAKNCNATIFQFSLFSVKLEVNSFFLLRLLCYWRNVTSKCPSFACLHSSGFQKGKSHLTPWLCGSEWTKMFHPVEFVNKINPQYICISSLQCIYVKFSPLSPSLSHDGVPHRRDGWECQLPPSVDAHPYFSFLCTRIVMRVSFSFHTSVSSYRWPLSFFCRLLCYWSNATSERPSVVCSQSRVLWEGNSYLSCNIPGCEARNGEDTEVCIAFMHRKSGKFLRF